MITTSKLHEFQMHGQGVPWLLAHQAKHRADKVALIWDPSKEQYGAGLIANCFGT